MSETIDIPLRQPQVWRIFISSTAQDLRPYRDAVAESIQKMGSFPVRMETFVAEATGPVTACLDKVRKCDVLVVMVAGRYGWIPSIEEGGDGETSKPLN